ncbi:MAG: addiction module protein, partial [Sandaracinus sp.]|nr:addiction module protein [Sandaracinus sp.]
MTSMAKKILDEALALPEDDRRRMAERLLDSVPRESADDVEG